MKSARTIRIISEALTFLLVILLTLFILSFIQSRMKTNYVSMQRHDISKVDLIIKAFIDGRYALFSEFRKAPDRRNAVGFMQ